MTGERRFSSSAKQRVTSAVYRCASSHHPHPVMCPACQPCWIVCIKVGVPGARESARTQSGPSKVHLRLVLHEDTDNEWFGFIGIPTLLKEPLKLFQEHQKRLKKLEDATTAHIRAQESGGAAQHPPLVRASPHECRL